MSESVPWWGVALLLLGPLVVVFVIYIVALVVDIILRARRRRLERPRGPDRSPSRRTPSDRRRG
ncbi:MAG TPA: hypothetical protein VF234_06825 [Limnochordia bacterium]